MRTAWAERERQRDEGNRGRGRDRGQVTIEFLGMTPLIIVTLVVVWQLVLVGYAYTLAGNAADEGVRAGTAAEGDMQGQCSAAGMKDLSGAWQGGADVQCKAEGGYVTADVRIKVPVLFPGVIDFPFTVTGHAGAVEEAPH
ncbi:TadE/TadG family type IV pilus assembly protein [Streptomyces sp. NPDC101152]|uniref:TadE/TadG family type IV pilus assembly protein n=1 Tax=Streptomyces sp. NPDC101152 TaxID=3366116 RepID=UPI00380024C3